MTDSPNASTRTCAIELLEKLIIVYKDEVIDSAIPCLETSLTDENGSVREAAAWCLLSIIDIDSKSVDKSSLTSKMIFETVAT